MTESDFLALGPQEKDALVAEKVMGWKKVRPHLDCLVGEPSEYPGEDNWHVDYLTTDISAAWQVVEKMHFEYEDITIANDCEEHNKEAVWFVSTASHDAAASTAPLAICIAALKAKKVIE